MNVSIRKSIFGLAVFFLTAVTTVNAQEFSLINGESTLTVLGTSSIHDWEVTAEKQSGKISFKDINAGQIDKCTIEIVAESLKSGKSSMDKNTYKALNTSSHKTINFQLAEVKKVTSKGDGVYAVNTTGDLTISGTKKRIPLDFTLTVKDSKVKLVGEKKIKMTDFKVEPPKAMFGTITTGDDLTIKFSTQFK
ncbi:YceI family protein [Mariniflexile sp.]|uniref:YceI family protein n=1 Tax=Mariniflexile sp. TaxID=1979402 RepID=UPI003569DBBB